MSMQSRVYGRVTEIVPVPNLKDLQVKSYRRFLQLDRPAHKRENVGLEAILREIFPIESFDKQLAVEYPATALLRCFAERYSTDADLLRIFYQTETIDLEPAKSLDKIAQKVAVSTIVDPNTGEALVEGGERIATEMAKVIRDAGVKS